MHPYYGSDRLVSASPTLIESVETTESEMLPGMVSNNGPASGVGGHHLTTISGPNLGLGSHSTPSVSGAGVLGNHYPIPVHVNPYSAPYQPVPIVSHTMSPPPGTTSSAAACFNNGFIPTTSSFLSMPLGTSSSILPVATSTPFVQFATPTTSDSLYTSTNKGYSPQVSFHFQSPTFSTPPIQMVAPQLDPLAAVGWQHTVPTSMPWASMSSLPSNLHFTAVSTGETSSQSSTTMANSNPKRLIKRKSTYDDNTVPEKIHVNEERMAARLETLHLDNNNLQWHPDLEDQWYSQKQSGASSTVSSSIHDESGEEREDRCGRGKAAQMLGGLKGAASSSDTRLNFTDLLKMGIKSQEILPKLIMDEISKPCMQVVLWKPPGNFVQEVVKDVTRDVTVTSTQEVTSEMNDVRGAAPGTCADVMETVPVPLSTLSWTQPGKTNESVAMDDMEL